MSNLSTKSFIEIVTKDRFQVETYTEGRSTKYQFKDISGRIITAKSEEEFDFAVNFINQNFIDDIAVQKKYSKELFDILLKLDCEWSIDNIIKYILQDTNPSEQSPQNTNIINLLKFIFSTPENIQFYQSLSELLIKKKEYYDRKNNPSWAELVYEYNGKDATKKLAATNFLIELLLKFAFKSFDLKQDMECTEVFNIHKPQYTESDRLGKIYIKIKLLLNLIKLKDHERNEQLSEASLKGITVSDNFNIICFNFLKHVKNEIQKDLTIINKTQEFGIVGSILWVLPEDYSNTQDFTKLYNIFMTGINEVCRIAEEKEDSKVQTASKKLSEIDSYIKKIEIFKSFKESLETLNKVTIAIYENPAPMASIKDWVEDNFPDGFDGKMNENKTYQELTEDSKNGLANTPYRADTCDAKLDNIIAPNYDANSLTNIPGLLKFSTSENDALFYDNVLRMGVQTYSKDGMVCVYPIFLRYLKTISLNIRVSETSFLYICNLRSSEAQTITRNEDSLEALRVQALINSAEADRNKNLNFEVVLIPANTGFLNHKLRECDGCRNQVFNSEWIKTQLKVIVSENGENFYLSRSTRLKLFGDVSPKEIDNEVSTWVDEAIDDLDLRRNSLKLSLSEIQQLATHFFKFTITNKLIEKLKPYRIATPCKDNIDRGMMHISYATIISRIFENEDRITTNQLQVEEAKQSRTNLDMKITAFLKRELHCGALLVKSRVMNEHNFGLLVHTLRGFFEGRLKHLKDDYPKLVDWINKNEAKIKIQHLNDERENKFKQYWDSKFAKTLSLSFPGETTIPSLATTLSSFKDNIIGWLRPMPGSVSTGSLTTVGSSTNVDDAGTSSPKGNSEDSLGNEEPKTARNCSPSSTSAGGN